MTKRRRVSGKDDTLTAVVETLMARVGELSAWTHPNRRTWFTLFGTIVRFNCQRRHIKTASYVSCSSDQLYDLVVSVEASKPHIGSRSFHQL